jgi:hypothetical protein
MKIQLFPCISVGWKQSVGHSPMAIVFFATPATAVINIILFQPLSCLWMPAPNSVARLVASVLPGDHITNL